MHVPELAILGNLGWRANQAKHPSLYLVDSNQRLDLRKPTTPGSNPEILSHNFPVHRIARLCSHPRHPVRPSDVGMLGWKHGPLSVTGNGTKQRNAQEQSHGTHVNCWRLTYCYAIPSKVVSVLCKVFVEVAAFESRTAHLGALVFTEAHCGLPEISRIMG